MKYFLSFAIILFVSCNQKKVKLRGNANTSITDSITNKTILKINYSSVCYLSLEGNKKQDTTALQLIIKGNDVSGKMYSIPYQKDSRIGTIKGKRLGDTIKVTWEYMQEGLNQTLQAEFLIQKKQLLQKEFQYDAKTGEQILDPQTKFSKKFVALNCANFPAR